ncbi:MAG TPA: glycosyltransferase [Streptomyces sp.]|uniref:glycosyltransferase n=1 Tax=Streptomyces sp. TaxID=1931 RepID=UPI002D2B5B75|nr:glycosyltransferase [Streptomyces sp.]HZG05466.1 glycosyltransferase [Streptomyces sp.]
MRMLFVGGVGGAGGGGTGTVLTDVPLAQAARTAGHEVVMAVPEAVLPAVLGCGVPAVAVTSRTAGDVRAVRQGGREPAPPRGPERDTAAGRALGRLAAASLDALLDLADRWRPDLVVGAVHAYAGPLAAHRAGVPWVRFATDIAEPLAADLAAAAELAPELERLGLREVPAPAFSVSLMPPGVRPAAAPVALPLRHVPCGAQRPLEPWMYTRGDRPRVLVSAPGGTAADGTDGRAGRLAALVEEIAALDVELLVATPDDAGAERLPLPGGARAGRLPLDVTVPTCDLVVHGADGGTTLTCLAHGVPQVLLPRRPEPEEHAGRLGAYGAARPVAPGDGGPRDVAGAVREVLADPSYRSAAERLRDEVRRMPLPDELVRELERAVVVHRTAAAA